MNPMLPDPPLDQVVAELLRARVRKVVNLLCGEGHLLRRLAAHAQFDRMVGVDTCIASLTEAQRALPLEEIRSGRLTLMYGPGGNLRKVGFDAAVMLQPVAQMGPRQLCAAENFLFGQIRSPLVVIAATGMDARGQDPLSSGLPGFATWASSMAVRHAYALEFKGGDEADALAARHVRMALFRRRAPPFHGPAREREPAEGSHG